MKSQTILDKVSTSLNKIILKKFIVIIIYGNIPVCDERKKFSKLLVFIYFY